MACVTTPDFDVAVVGGGMIGASLAYRLTRAGRRVVVLDGRGQSGRATDNSFSWLNAVAKEPESYHRLNAAGMAEWERLAREAAGIEVHRSGCLEWHGSAEAERDLERKVARLHARGYAARWIAADQVEALEPGLRVPPDARIACYDRDGWVHAPDAARVLIEQVCAAGGEVRAGCTVTDIQHGGKLPATIETSGGAVSAGVVALCAGVGTAALAQRLAVELPVEARPGLLAITTPVPAGVLGRVVYAPGVHLRPDVSGGLRLGADDVDELVSEHFDVWPIEPVEPPPWAHALLDRARAVLPALESVDLDHVRIGVRPVPRDGHTVCGRLPDWANVYVAVTHSGITLGPLLGRLLAEEIVEGRRDLLLADFRPERFAVAR
jgi:glycine/D-amino acid oxidase-like deaminating enzyme